MSKGYKDLLVWQKAIDLGVVIYDMTSQFPKEETYSLVSQMRRSVVSISSNIAEGSKRNTRKDFIDFLAMALGSGAELESQIEIVKRLRFGEKLDFRIIDMLLNEVMKMNTTLIQKLKTIN